MGWNIGVSEGEKIVHAVISGEVTMEHARQMASEGLEMAGRHGVSRFLADVRAVNSQISTVQIYLLPKVLEVLGLARDSRVALVTAKDPEQENDFRFCQTVAGNQGFAIGLFYEPDQARQWLLDGT